MLLTESDVAEKVRRGMDHANLLRTVFGEVTAQRLISSGLKRVSEEEMKKPAFAVHTDRLEII